MISHAKNCTVHLNKLILVSCADGWVSLGDVINFFKYRPDHQNYDFEDMMTKGIADMVISKGDYIMYVNPRKFELTIWQQYMVADNEFYK